MRPSAPDAPPVNPYDPGLRPADHVWTLVFEPAGRRQPAGGRWRFRWVHNSDLEATAA
jgi:hypothetical protein